MSVVIHSICVVCRLLVRCANKRNSVLVFVKL